MPDLLLAHQEHAPSHTKAPVTFKTANADDDACNAAATGGEAKAIAAFRAWREAGAAGAGETAPGAS